MRKLLRSMTFWVVVAALAGYAAAGLFDADRLHAAGDNDTVYGTILLLKTSFLKLLRMMIPPIVFFSLIGGLLNMGRQRRLQRLGSTTILYYLGTTAIAIVIGLAAVLLIHPWTRHAPGPGVVATADDTAPATSLLQQASQVKNPRLIEGDQPVVTGTVRGLLMQAFVNPVAALANINILGIVFNALIIGLAMARVLPENSPIPALVDDINLVLHRILAWVLLTIPVGVLAIVFDFHIRMAADPALRDGNILAQLLSFSWLVLAATMLHGLVVLPGLAWFFTGLAPHRFLARIGKPLLVALSTSSSSSTLPVTMDACETRLDIAPGVAGFVCPLGATMNMDGTALFEGIAAVFLAHLAGIPLGTTEIVVIFAMAMISSIGAPGMPSGSMSGMQMVMLAVGIPLEWIALLLIVERPLDTFRTAVNVEGDIAGALIVDRRLKKGS